MEGLFLDLAGRNLHFEMGKARVEFRLQDGRQFFQAEVDIFRETPQLVVYPGGSSEMRYFIALVAQGGFGYRVPDRATKSK